MQDNTGNLNISKLIIIIVNLNSLSYIYKLIYTLEFPCFLLINRYNYYFSVTTASIKFNKNNNLEN